MFEVEWQGDSCVAASWEEVEAKLAEIEQASARPVAATVIRRPGGELMTIGLGHERSFLNYMPGSMRPPYFTSVGESDSDEIISFIFGNQLTEFFRSQTVRREVAFRVLRHFSITGERSKEIRWEMD